MIGFLSTDVVTDVPFKWRCSEVVGFVEASKEEEESRRCSSRFVRSKFFGDGVLLSAVLKRLAWTSSIKFGESFLIRCLKEARLCLARSRSRRIGSTGCLTGVF